MPDITMPQNDYSPTVAAKDGVWGVSKFSAAVSLSPVVLSTLANAGVHVDPGSTAAKVFPVLIFLVLHLIHDWAALKSKVSWL